jgi:hypothetical protein
LIIIKNNNEENTDVINGNTAILKVHKKDGSILEAKIDTDDLKRVLEKGIWFAEWHKDFNNFLVQNISYSSEDKHHCEKQNLQSFILGVNTKAPIRHINGDTLDNRKSNLELFNQNTINDYVELDSETVGLILRDKYGKENAKAIIDKQDLNKIINSGYAWVVYKIKGEPYVVANTQNGRVFLNRFIMDTPEEMISHHINLNPLDNRRLNLENKVLNVISDTVSEDVTDIPNNEDEQF